MSIGLKILIIFALLYLGFLWVTKPFRLAYRQAKKAAEQGRRRQDHKQQKEIQTETKTEDLGDYIDYEEINEL